MTTYRLTFSGTLDGYLTISDEGVESDLGLVSDAVAAAFRSRIEAYETPVSEPIAADMEDPEWVAVTALDHLAMIYGPRFYEALKEWDTSPFRETIGLRPDVQY